MTLTKAKRFDDAHRAMGLAPVQPLTMYLAMMWRAGLEYVRGPAVYQTNPNHPLGVAIPHCGYHGKQCWVPALAAELIRSGINMHLRGTLLARFVAGDTQCVQAALTMWRLGCDDSMIGALI